MTRTTRTISFADLGAEPFRIFFPTAVLVGIYGVSMWPLHFAGIVPFYPGASHARLMANGFFGGFIFGFLGTAMPRMLSSSPLKVWEAFLLWIFHAAMCLSYACGRNDAGDVLALALLSSFAAIVGRRLPSRKDVPPPGFVLVLMGLASLVTGIALALTQPVDEPSVFAITLQHLFSYQGFVLFPIMGVGPFILPRLFEMPSRHNFDESRTPPPGWTRRAATAVFAGLAIVGTFFLEASGAYQIGPALRMLIVITYLALEMPLRGAFAVKNTLARAFRIALIVLLLGFVGAAIFPQYRVALLHLTLIGGFAVITFTVATRVIFGHSGNLERLKLPNRWFTVATLLMLFGMATRVSGDFWPRIAASHYTYGAVLWVAGVIVWSAYVLPKVRFADPE